MKKMAFGEVSFSITGKTGIMLAYDVRMKFTSITKRSVSNHMYSLNLFGFVHLPFWK